MIKIATQLGSSHEKTSTPNSVPKLIAPGIISNNLYSFLSLGFFMSEAFEMLKYSLFSMVAPQGFEPWFLA